MSDNSANLGNNWRQDLGDDIQNTLNKQDESNPD
jgi:hypothetical protein